MTNINNAAFLDYAGFLKGNGDMNHEDVDRTICHITVLTLSVKHVVQLCVARQGGFVGDALDECCRRAKANLETSTTLQLVSINPATPPTRSNGKRRGRG